MAQNLFELIADPVRLAIVRQLSRDRSVPLTQIADGAGVHANTVRSHISELESAGVVERESVARGPGRPPLRYRLGAGWRLPSDDMRGLSELLAALVLSLDPDSEDIRQLGGQWGRFLSGRPGGDAVAGLPRMLERLGFDAEIDGCEIRLTSCPCPSQHDPARRTCTIRLAETAIARRAMRPAATAEQAREAPAPAWSGLRIAGV